MNRKIAYFAVVVFLSIPFSLSAINQSNKNQLAINKLTDSEFVGAQTAPSIYWGARMDGEVYGLGDAPWDDTTWSTFEQHAGKKASILHWGITYPDQFNNHVSTLQKVKSRGAISLVTWSTAGLKPKDINAGLYDAYFKT